MTRSLFIAFTLAAPLAADAELIQSTEDWNRIAADPSGIEIADGLAVSTAAESHFTSQVIPIEGKKKLKAITFRQTPQWNNWEEVPNVGTPEMRDAPVLLPVKEGDYWLLAGHKDYRDETNGGYHAWHSEDMETWTHHGAVSGKVEKWMTTAEHVDGTFYLYYDKPNDEDPHLILDKDLTDGKMGKSIGMVWKDPSHGSDAGILRDEDGSFNLIYENWDPINARTHAWDSPLAGRAVSPDGIQPFKHANQVVDERSKPTGKMGEYDHPSGKEPYQYEIHEPEQNAYGDWTAIKIGGRYYLFCDYDPVGEKIRVGRWTSTSLDEQFEWCGELGDGHPDPTIGFAAGKFYLLQQRADVDFVSPGPWVPGVEARVGVDTSGNGKVDQWGEWQEIAESYQLKPGFSRVVETEPAQLKVKGLPAGKGFAFEYRTSAHPDANAPVEMDEVELTLK